MRRALQLVVVLFAVVTSAGELTLDRRVASERAIQGVYHAYRIWPAVNPGAKPSLDEVLPVAASRAKVEDDLRKASALKAIWGRPLTAAQLAAELRRMAAASRDPGMLRELFAALGDDPVRVAECLVRPRLADRLLRSWYAADTRFHGEVAARARREREAMASMGMVAAGSGTLAEQELRRTDRAFPTVRHDLGVVIRELPAEMWEAEVARLRRALGLEAGDAPLVAGRLGPLVEESDRFVVTAVVTADGERIRVRTVEWAKVPFESWWQEHRGGFAPDPTVIAGDATALPELQTDPCADDSWTPIPEELPRPRFSHTAVWTGSEMLVWGGWPPSRTGERYDPVTDTWSAMPTGGALPPTFSAPAVWTGQEMVVWGGSTVGAGGEELGAAFDPVTSSWRTLSTIDQPARRSHHTMVWTGSEVLVWGGRDRTGRLDDGGRYDPSTDTWSAITEVGAPVARESHTAVWTGTTMVVWGGEGCLDPPECSTTGTLDTGGVYDPVADVWAATSEASAPSPRQYHTAVWTGSSMIVWGGGGCLDPPECSSWGVLDTGGRYDPVSDLWLPTTLDNAPGRRSYHTAVWTGSEMIVWGGQQCLGLDGCASGGRYDLVADSWTPTQLEGAPGAVWNHSAVWTGSEMIVFGGYNVDEGAVRAGGRYSPATDSWTPTAQAFSPVGGWMADGAWTGAELLVWGEGSQGGRWDPTTAIWTPVPQTEFGSSVNTVTVWTGNEVLAWREDGQGYRFDPGANVWAPLSLLGAPPPRVVPTAVWTGTEMIVWGGTDQDGDGTGVGGRYDPVADAWTPVSQVGAPSARQFPGVVWTGQEVLVWGGSGPDTVLADGARYDPGLDAWRPISAVGAPSPRGAHSATWTGDEMVVWGGGNDVGELGDGARYDPFTDTWRPMSAAMAPSPRALPSAVWTGTEVVVWGGVQWQGVSPVDGARYVPASERWTPMTLDGAPAPRFFHLGLRVGERVLVWGGYSEVDGWLSDGGLYCALPRPVAAAEPSSLDFGRVVVGSSSAEILRVRNLGSAPLVVTAVTSPEPPFAKVGDSCTGATLAPGGSCPVALELTPPSPGPEASAVLVQTTDPHVPVLQVELAGEGVDVRMAPVSIAVDDGGGNGLVEPGESIGLAPRWRNLGIAAALGVEGGMTTADPVEWFQDFGAYGDVAAGAVSGCSSCYSLTVGPYRPSPHWDLHLHEDLNTGDATTWVVHVGASFDDVPVGSWAYSAVETAFHHGITAGCGAALYCPTSALSRAQAAVLLLRAEHGPDWWPPRPSGVLFADVPPRAFASAWIEALAGEGITAGCGGGRFCPDDALARRQLAVLLLRTLEDRWYQPPPAVGLFADVPVEDPFAPWIEEIARRGITAGCGGGLFCPDAPVDRAQAAVLLTRGFGMSLEPVATVP